MRYGIDIWNGFDELSNNLSEKRTFSPFFEFLEKSFENRKSSVAPACDIEEKKDHWLLSLDVPGVRKEDIKVEVEGNLLTVQAERNFEKEEKESRAVLKERFYGSFARTVQLPQGVEQKDIEVVYRDGVLRIALPKGVEEVKRPLEVKTEASRFLA